MACFLCDVPVFADVNLIDRDWVAMGFRFELSRLLTGVGLAAIPVAIFGSDWPVGTIAGCMAGVGLLVLSLTFQRKHIRPACVVLTCQAIGMFLGLLLAPCTANTSTPFEATFFTGLVFGASIGGLWGFLANAVERRNARSERKAN